jgi:TetR/AcrR family transcriptional regulator
MTPATAQRRRAQIESANTRERILDVAEALFAARGFAGTAVRDIAREAELTPASLYNHFDGKQALYEAVLERGVRPLFAVLEAFAARPQTELSAGDIIDEIMSHLAARPHLPALVQQETITGGEALVRLARGWIAPLVETALLGMKAQPNQSVWREDEYPHFIFAWLHLVFGYFALAPLMREVTGEDALAPESLARQTAFLRKLADLIMSAGRRADA